MSLYSDVWDLYKKVQRLCCRVKALEEGGTDTNFANTNLTFDDDHTHDGDGNDLVLENFSLIEQIATNGSEENRLELIPGIRARLQTTGAEYGLVDATQSGVTLDSSLGNYAMATDPPLDAGESDYIIGRDDLTGLLYRVSLPGGGSYEEVTYAEAETLVSTDAVVPGTLYKITDRGDRGIFVTGLTTSEFSQTGHRLMLIPVTYAPGVNVTYNSLTYTSAGMFSRYTAEAAGGYAVDTLVIYNGHYWIAEATTAATIVDSSAMQSIIGTGFGDWRRIEKTEPEAVDLYTEVLFDIKYDFANDWIYEQSDKFNNVVGIDFATYTIFSDNGLIVENPINFTDWGLAIYKSAESGIYSTISNNKLPFGFYNNAQETLTQDYYIEGNACSHVIHNYCAGSTLYVQGNLSQCTHSVGDYPGIGGIRNNINYDADLDISKNIFTLGVYSNTACRISSNVVGEISSNQGIEPITIRSNTGFKITGNSLEEEFIQNNKVTYINDNVTEGPIDSNVSDYISSNICESISNNVCQNISNNNITGNISYNQVNTNISSNTNQGLIYGNVVLAITNNDNGIGNIENNKNNGSISLNSSSGGGPWDINNNINNGNISNAHGAHVTDTIVNK